MPLAPAPARAQTATQTATTAATSGSPPPPVATGAGFDFGSYGRVGVGSDASGHEGYATNVVSHGSRLEETPYLELDLYYTGIVGDDARRRWRLVLAPAFAGDLFHYSGSFDSHVAIRNAYIETQNVGLAGLSLWAGSRMLRGDDIYLFDYWPLDNLNTIGGGAAFAPGPTEVSAHVGLNRLDDPYQFENLTVPPRGLGPPGQATVLDRPRFLGSAKATRRFGSFPGAKISVYGELHLLPEGQFVDPMTLRQVPLPGDDGFVLGAQLGGWLRPFVFFNLWLRYAGGLAAYGELAVPATVDSVRQVSGAREIVLATTANWETRRVGLMLGAYLRRFDDPAGGEANPQSFTEGIVAARPHLYLTRHFQTALEVSYQARQSDGLDYLAERVLHPRVFRFSILPLVAPLGPGTYSRPQIYAVYTVSDTNGDARVLLYDTQDFRYRQGVVHYLGIGAEWWFNSSYR